MAKVTVTKSTPAPVVSGVSLSLTAGEASMLRRIMYYNKTVASKFKSNPNGGRRKADDILAFATSLGNSLKAQGIERF